MWGHETTPNAKCQMRASSRKSQQSKGDWRCESHHFASR